MVGHVTPPSDRHTTVQTYFGENLEDRGSAFFVVHQGIENKEIGPLVRAVHALLDIFFQEPPGPVKNAFQDLLQRGSTWLEDFSRHGYEDEVLGRLIEFACAHPDLEDEEESVALILTKAILSRDVVRGWFLPPLLELYTSQYLRNGYIPVVHRSHLSDHISGSPREDKDANPRIKELTDLWDLVATGQFSKALRVLSPLVNFLVEQEGKGIYPLGIGISGQNMSEVRYHPTTPMGFAEVDDGTRHAMDLAFAVAQDQGAFCSEMASQYAQNILIQLYLDYSCWLPGDLARLMNCHDDIRNSEPIEKRWSDGGSPDKPKEFYTQRPPDLLTGRTGEEVEDAILSASNVVLELQGFGQEILGKRNAEALMKPFR